MAKLYIQHLMILTDEEKEYLDRFGKGEYRPDLLFSDDNILMRIEKYPMALWKCQKKRILMPIR
ncbi:MAG: hypothetical protein LKE75_05555 [Lachnospiraceae bacterium]|jgi:hypothetical protein|nr:hypothetical protein [Lachnospiraceae bacterium]MCH4030894.1 hypothetical protein [Lachnospiraceae bacterium]MCH4070867.1 hypothetical protein [Lachnospiraceae bacterium]MCI1362297.1 hypothetical protein [Lachnospiraceae bacterium]MCI1402649.1 hypothetical protein [Lachnospiraceae bacterium]